MVCPHTSYRRTLYIRKLNLHVRGDGSTKYNAEPDFKFIVIEKFLSIENEFALKEGILLSSYFYLKRLGLSDEKAFGLEKSDVLVEQVPLLFQQANTVMLVKNISDENEHVTL